MKMPTLPLLLFAVMALTRAADAEAGQELETAVLPDAEAEQETGTTVFPDVEAGKQAETEGEIDVFKSGNSCQRGWSQYGRRCFHFVPRRMNWSDAVRNCRSMGATLASVHNAGEYHWIQKVIADRVHAHPEAWLGGSDLSREGHWRWVDGTGFGFSYWCRGEPNNFAGQDCLQMNYSGGRCWDDVWCHDHRASVCAKNV